MKERKEELRKVGGETQSGDHNLGAFLKEGRLNRRNKKRKAIW